MTKRTALLAWSVLAPMGLAFLGPAMAQEEIDFLSTQLRPIEEAQKVQDVILADFEGSVAYLVEEPPQFDVRMRAEGAAGSRTIDLVGALHGELQPLIDSELDPIDDVAAKLGDRGVPPTLMTLGKLGTANQIYVPWMQATYIMVARKEALDYLPDGAELDKLTYEELAAWAKAIFDQTGKRVLAFPAGPKGLMHRFLQGYLYPSFTGGVVTRFRSAQAVDMWDAFKSLWQYVNPNSTSYDFMQDPLLAEEVWIAFDHVARVKVALDETPDDYVTFAAPAGPAGRGYMPVVAGLAIPKDAPDRTGAIELIDYLMRPEIQVLTAQEVGFFPTVKVALPPDLSPGTRLLADAVVKTQEAEDALVALLPVGLGDKGGEFNKIYLDTFARIVLRGEAAKTVLEEEGEALAALMTATGAPCWQPDQPSDGACPVD